MWKNVRLVMVWFVFTAGFSGAAFAVTRSVTSREALGRARLALVESGVTKATATISGSSLVLSGEVLTPAEHVSAVVAVRRHYPKRRIIDQIRIIRVPTNDSPSIAPKDSEYSFGEL